MKQTAHAGPRRPNEHPPVESVQAADHTFTTHDHSNDADRDEDSNRGECEWSDFDRLTDAQITRGHDEWQRRPTSRYD
jgi:hypothetical protein